MATPGDSGVRVWGYCKTNEATPEGGLLEVYKLPGPDPEGERERETLVPLTWREEGESLEPEHCST